MLPNGVLHLEWARDCTITAEDAEAAEATKSVTREARAVFAVPSSLTRVALLGSSPVDRMLANFFLGMSPPPCPTQFFTSRRLATAWLGTDTDERPPTG